jgi:hypothetical protein
MFVITWNGKTTVLTGWRAWLVGAVLCVAAALALVVAAFLVLGLTITIAALLLFVVPLAIVIALLSAGLRALRGG